MYFSIPFPSEPQNWLFFGPRNASEWAVFSTEWRKPFRVYSTECFRNDIPLPTLVDAGGKFATGANDTGGKFSAGDVETGGKFATGVVDTGGASWFANISAN